MIRKMMAIIEIHKEIGIVTIFYVDISLTLLKKPHERGSLFNTTTVCHTRNVQGRPNQFLCTYAHYKKLLFKATFYVLTFTLKGGIFYTSSRCRRGRGRCGLVLLCRMALRLLRVCGSARRRDR